MVRAADGWKAWLSLAPFFLNVRSKPAELPCESGLFRRCCVWGWIIVYPPRSPASQLMIRSCPCVALCVLSKGSGRQRAHQASRRTDRGAHEPGNTVRCYPLIEGFWVNTELTDKRLTLMPVGCSCYAAQRSSTTRVAALHRCIFLLRAPALGEQLCYRKPTSLGSQ